MAELNFNANDVAPNESRDVLPAGEYDVAIVASEAYTTTSGKMAGIKIEMQVLNGKHQNRKLWDRINFRPAGNAVLSDGEKKAIEIGAGNLSSLCRAVGVLTPKDSSELHGKAFRVKVKVKQSDEYGPQNNIAAYKSRNSLPEIPAGSDTTPAGLPTGVANDTPW